MVESEANPGLEPRIANINDYRRVEMHNKSITERFWPKVDIRGPDECWPWIGAHDARGYGHIYSGGGAVKVLKAHRVSFEINFGPITLGLYVLHKCDNPPCVNPRHLFTGTQKDNMRDRDSKGRQASHKGTDNGRAKLTESQVLEILRLPWKHDEIAAAFGVSRASVSAIRRRERWPHIGRDQ